MWTHPDRLELRCALWYDFAELSVVQRESAAIILAGGRSCRMGADKALLEIDGEVLLARVTRVVSAVAAEVVIVGRTDLPPQLVGTPTIRDEYPEAGPMEGIATGLAHLDTDRALVVACDLPFLQVDLLRLLLRLAPGYDAVVPRIGGNQGGSGGHIQPTCAVYARSCLPVLRRRLAERRYRLGDVFGDLQIRWVKDEEIRGVDPDYRSFVNANTPEEWHEITARV